MEDANHTRVLNLVRRAVVTSPELDSHEIYELATQRYPWVKELDLRQFSGRFVRRARREAGVTTPRKRRAKAARVSQADRPRIEGAAVPKWSPRTNGPAERQHGPSGGGSKRDRAQVYRAFVEFAQEMVAAESARDVVEVIRRLDPYVDRVLEGSPAEPT